MPLLSIILCTRDPSREQFSRVLTAVAALRLPAGWEREVVIVDNASSVPLVEVEWVRDLIAGLPGLRVITEPRPGHSNARQAGTQATSGDLIVWFDDDNEPAPSYLEAVVVVAQAQPAVLAFGAGRIIVEFTGPVTPWAAKHAPVLHQERIHDVDEFVLADRFVPCTPFGSGLVTRRIVMEHWIRERTAGRYTLGGRTGARLDSGEDSEILFEARRRGGLVGVSPHLILRHLIPPSRTTMRYLARLTFATSGAVRVARREAFGSEGLEPLPGLFAPIAGGRTVLAAIRRENLRAGLITGSAWLGALAGTFMAHQVPEPAWFRATTKLLRLR